MRHGTRICVLTLLVAFGADARPGGGSSFRGGSSSSRSSSSSGSSRSSSGSSYRSSSGSSYRSSSGSSDRSSSSSSGTSGTSSIQEASFSYTARRAEDRPSDAKAVWRPGALGPYGSGPARPAVLPIQAAASSDSRGLSFASVFLFGLVGIPLMVGGFAIRVVTRRRSGWTSAKTDLAAGEPPPAVPAAAVRKELEAIRQFDPDFSLVLLEDFLYALYAEAQTARGQGNTVRLSPYLGPAARAKLGELGAHPVSGVVVGALGFVRFAAGQRLELSVEIESNYAEQHPDQVRGFYARERWRLIRNPVARSRPPDRARVLGCPNCGAPLDRLLGGTCQYCTRVVDQGNYDWSVESIEILERSERGPMLTGTVEEQGTQLATVFDPGLMQGLAYLHQKDGAFSEQAFSARVALIFSVMQEAWSTLNWQLCRPLLSDNLFEVQSYWIGAYRAQGLRNVTERARITNLELVRFTADKWFDAVTVRVHATGLDYTLRVADGAVVGGHRDRERAYTEYWTLIRGAGRTGATRTAAECPNCGAPLQVNMAAVCNYCQAKVNSGAFDWVLSRIEQDEVYVG
jgi:uncharacterized Zn finger protein (UPF0148 family)